MATRRFSIYNTIPNLMSVWDWTKQFSTEDISLFKNPLYVTRYELKTQLNRVWASNQQNWVKKRENGILEPVVSAPMLKFWGHCYLRWMTPVQILAGGSPLEYLTQCILVEEIVVLQHKVETMLNATPFNKADRRKSTLIFGSDNNPTGGSTSINMSLSSRVVDASRTPRSARDLVTSSFPYSPDRLPSHVSFLGTPISLFLEKSMLGTEDSESDDDFDDFLLRSNMKTTHFLETDV